jgi:hypothetical protein
VHSAAFSSLLDRTFSLTLGADEEDIATVGDGLGDKLLRPEQSPNRLFDVDDVDTVTLAVDVRRHFRVPPAGVMTKVHAGIK